jgi:hypothetical protein
MIVSVIAGLPGSEVLDARIVRRAQRLTTSP